MSDALDPKGPSQPSINTSYNTEGNPISHSSQENYEASSKTRKDGGSVAAQRERGDLPVPSQHHDAAVPTAMAQGVRDSSQDKGESVGPAASDLDGEQMRAPGEGEIYQKQFNKTGFGEQQDMASDLDRKKQEQAGAREAIKEQRRQGVDVGGALGDKIGPAGIEGR